MKFSAVNRRLGEEDELRLTSVGVDIGSATTHLVFSALRVQRRNSRYVTVERKILRESDILLTPYCDGELTRIDAQALGAFVRSQYVHAGLKRDDVDTGAVILTGMASSARNAREIADVFADEAGRFVTVTAGDSLEATLAAYGSGALHLSQSNRNCINVDMGGGTTKVAVCIKGQVQEVTTLDVGARLVLRDSTGVVTYISEPCRYLIREIGLEIHEGALPREEDLRRLVGAMADAVVEVLTDLDGPSRLTRHLLRLAPLARGEQVNTLVLSGGVSEYLFGGTRRTFGDLGPLLAEAIYERGRARNWSICRLASGIRATAMGVSQHTVQVSGSTVFVSPMGVLPLRSIPVVTPNLELDDDHLSESKIAAALQSDLNRMASGAQNPVAIGLAWMGSATFSRMQALTGGLLLAMDPWIRAGHPLIVVNDGDIGGILGMHLKESIGTSVAVVSIDGIDLKPFDFIDIGPLMASSGAVPVVIKSLVFAPQLDAW